MRWSTALKLKAAAVAWCAPGVGAARVVAGSAIGVDAEKDLSILDRVRVLDEDVPHDARELGLDLVHDLHCLDDAEDLSFRDARPCRDVSRRPGLWGPVEGPDHGRLELEPLGLGLRLGRLRLAYCGSTLGGRCAQRGWRSGH